MYLDKGHNSEVTSNTANYLPKDVCLKRTTIGITLSVAIKKVKGD
jgi:hypothetical protein